MDFSKKESLYKKVMIIIVTSLITFLITTIVFYNYYIKTDKGNIEILSKQISLSNSTETLEQKLEIIKKYLERSYIGELDEEKMVEGAIKGYVDGIGDKYTEYLTPEELEDLMINVNGNYVGIGIYMTKDNDGNIIVLLPIEGSPAEREGLQTGDIILRVNETECTGLELSEVANLVKGEEGTTVNVEILRDEKTFKLDIKREKVELKYIDSKVLDNNIGYIKVLSFEEGATNKVKEEIKKLKDQNVQSIIIDMRDNGGGLVTEAVGLSEFFIPAGKTILKSYNKEGKETVTKSTAITNEKLNLVVLVNENSASATEIFAGAIQDNNIGTLIGTKTFGKGVMQEIQPLSIGGALKITIEEFKTPNGNKIHEVGITPDIEIKRNTDDLEKDNQLEKAIECLSK